MVFAVIFQAEIAQLDGLYYKMAEQMRQLAQTKYGCLEFISLSEGDREIAISYWPSQAHISAWKDDPEHQNAQRLGRSRWYRSYKVEVVKIEREYAVDHT